MRILMLGNSLTSANDLPAQLAELLDADVVAHTRGGARLAEYGWTRAELHELLQAGYREAAEAGGALLADVGGAFMAAGEDAGLYAADGIHPSAAGSQLAAEVIASTIRGLAGAGTGIRGA